MPTIFVVEDDPNHIIIIEASLKALQHDLIALDHPSKLRAELEHTIPDLILMDIRLPGENGIELMEWLRQDDRYNKIPIAILTANASEKTRRDSLQGGADAFITKPIFPAQLQEVVQSLIPRQIMS